MNREVVRATGHQHVSATHESTLELTSDDWLTPAGDCILGIEADRTPASFAAPVVAACQNSDAAIRVTLAAGDVTDQLAGRGDPRLSFASDRSLVIRTSEYVDDRTVMVDADKAAADIDRALVRAARAGSPLTATFVVDPQEGPQRTETH